MKGSLSEPIVISGPPSASQEMILSAGALDLLAELHRTFDQRRRELLDLRQMLQRELDDGENLDFLPETADVRESEWRVAPIPADLLDRRVEITGPTDRKMVINALNSGAKVFMADFEDANAPFWANMIEGQRNLYDAVRRTITYTGPEGRIYQLNEKPAVLFVRPRGWHLVEKHVLIDGRQVSGSLFDFALYFYHNAKELLARGTGPYFYLPKMESYLEARLWNDVFNLAQDKLGVPRGSIRATVLIETIPAAFQMDEILHELRDHSAGLNCGRWDYIFNCIKRFRSRADFVLADRALVTMTTHFMRSYSLLCIKTCHRRQIHAMGGMAAQIPVKNNDEANRQAFAKVEADKDREATDGHDGTWVAHPALVPVAYKAFDQAMPTANQIHRQRDDVNVGAADLLRFEPKAPITEQGVRINISVGIQYLEAWLRGSGAVPIFNLMEDAATAEISRAQLWQWLRSPNGKLDDGRKLDTDLFQKLFADEMFKLETLVGPEKFRSGRYEAAADLFQRLITTETFAEFLTLPGYDLLD
jgi:malate synthase